MRYSIELCDEEKAFVDKRKKIVFEAMRKILGERGPKSLDEVTRILRHFITTYLQFFPEYRQVSFENVDIFKITNSCT